MPTLRERPETNAVEAGTLPPFDAWAFACALTGQALDAEDRRISAPNRPLARLMAEAPSDDRQQVWDKHIATLSEAEGGAWIEAVAVVSPGDPPPEDDSWGEPLAFKLPPVEPFPLEVYPPPVAHLARHGARSIGCPLDFLALPVLSVAGAAIGRSANLHLKSRYFASASIFAACVGLPGDGKSPAIGAVASPMRQIDEANFAKWKEEKVAFEALSDTYESACKAAKKTWPEITELDELDDETREPELPEIPTRPVPPILGRSTVSDITIEAMDTIMEQNPRGLLQVLDEASSLMTSMNQYRGGKGSDRQWYMSVWSGEPRTVDRKGHAEKIPIRVPHPFLGFIGGIVPDMIGSFCDERGRHDGFIDRFLFTYPDPVPKTGWHDEGIPDGVADEWSRIIGRLQAHPMKIEDLRSLPHVVHLSPEGKTAWRELINAHHAEQSAAGFRPSLSGPWAKLEQYAGRIVLVLHMLGLAADADRNLSSLPEVSATTVQNAALLLNYLKGHTLRIHDAMKARARGEEGNEDAQCILKWIFRRQSESFSRRDLTRDLSATFSKRPKALEEALNWLVKSECIRRLPEPERPNGSRGRSRAPAYLVNPHLLPPQNCQNRETNAPPMTGPGHFVNSVNSAMELEASTGEEDGDGDIPS